MVLELRVSTHLESRMLSVGYGERGAVLPSEVRVLGFTVGELVARSIDDRLETAHAGGQEPVLELDDLVARAERVLAIAAARQRAWTPEERAG